MDPYFQKQIISIGRYMHREPGLPTKALALLARVVEPLIRIIIPRRHKR